MNLENFKSKKSVVIVFSGDGKGKTSAALGLVIRALGARHKVAFVQFIKYWGVSEHIFFKDIQNLYEDQLYFYKGGKGFYNAGVLSEKNITKEQHISAAKKTLAVALKAVKSGEYDLVVCDEINNAVHDKLLTIADLKKLINDRASKTSICLTGRNFPNILKNKVDIYTEMKKIVHHFDNNFIANRGIDY